MPVTVESCNDEDLTGFEVDRERSRAMLECNRERRDARMAYVKAGLVKKVITLQSNLSDTTQIQ